MRPSHPTRERLLACACVAWQIITCGFATSSGPLLSVYSDSADFTRGMTQQQADADVVVDEGREALIDEEAYLYVRSYDNVGFIKRYIAMQSAAEADFMVDHIMEASLFQDAKGAAYLDELGRDAVWQTLRSALRREFDERAVDRSRAARLAQDYMHPHLTCHPYPLPLWKWWVCVAKTREGGDGSKCGQVSE